MKNDKCNLNETFNGDKSFYDNEFSDESNMDKNKKNRIKEKGGYYRRMEYMRKVCPRIIE